MSLYAKPINLDEALTLLGDAKWRILAGGTDFYPAQGTRPLTENILDINGIDELRGIAETDGHVILGARTTWSDVLRHELPHGFDALKQAAREVGSVQIQNTASIAGNLCNASPAADGVPPLMVLDAEVELRSVKGSRWLKLDQFILGNRHTAKHANEIVTSIRVPKAATRGGSAFVKLGARRYLVISIAMAAARVIVARDGTIKQAAISVGSCSAVAQRLAGLEADLVGLSPGADLSRAVANADLSGLSPIDDVRGTATYRREAAREIVLRAVSTAARPAAPAKAAA